MELACLVCEQAVRVSLAAEARDSERQRARSDAVSSVPNGAKGSRKRGQGAPATSNTSAGAPGDCEQGGAVTRCTVCDGLYHTPCLLQIPEGQTASDDVSKTSFVCGKCCHEEKIPAGSGAAASCTTESTPVLPLLVPAAALPYLRVEESTTTRGRAGAKDGGLVANSNTEDNAVHDDASAGWRVFSTAVEVCTTCRQVEIAAEDREPSTVDSGEQRHVRCMRHRKNLSTATVALGADKPGRKRRRSSSSIKNSADATSQTTAIEPAEGLSSGDGGGSIETRTIALLVHADTTVSDEPREHAQVQWWETCTACGSRFCLHEFSDAQETDSSLEDILARAPLDEDGDNWRCAHCNSEAELNGLQSTAGAGLATVIICDGCDAEVDIATLNPPLEKVPAGEWFCENCSAKAKSKASGASKRSKPTSSRRIRAGAPTTTSEEGVPSLTTSKEPTKLVTVLICDGCDGEFDVARIVPRLTTIPKGQWFCNTCAAAKSFSGSGGKATAPAVSVPMTLLICDGCDGEFDMRTLKPPLTEVPSGEWFCPTCARNLKKMGKERRRRVKIGMTRKRSRVKQPAASSVVTQVTVLMCDGCDGEFDPLALNPPLLQIPEGEWFCEACSGQKPSSTCEVIKTCVGCDLKFESAANPLRRPSENVDGMLLCEACRNLQAGGYTRRRGISSTNSSQDPSVREDDTISSSGKKRRRSAAGSRRSGNRSKKSKRGSHGNDGVAVTPSAVQDPLNQAAANDKEFPHLIIPQPVVLVSSSSSRRGELDITKSGNGWSAANPTVVVADSDDDAAAGADDEEDEDNVIRIVCDICFNEFKMADVLGTGDASAVPARPWYCSSCLKSLKRNRKKKQRFSKQMLLEMQIYGSLLRPTAAKVVDVDAAAQRGKPPNSREERRKMYELIGKSVGVFLQWDKQWVMGRVMAFHATHPKMHHTVRFDDGVVASLPLYAFPLVVGTRTMLYVKVPALQNRWWPAQVLRLNSLAKKVLVPTPEEEAAARANFRLVRVFASSESIETTHNVSCWVPKYLCRSMKRFTAPLSPDPVAVDSSVEAREAIMNALDKSVKRAKAESASETDVLNRVFQQLLANFRQTTAESALPPVEDDSKKDSQPPKDEKSGGNQRWSQVAKALVGKTVVITVVGSSTELVSPEAYVVESFEEESKLHRLLRCGTDSGKDTGVAADLLGGGDGCIYYIKDPSTFSELAIMLEVSGSDARSGDAVFHSKELLEKAITRETGLQSGKGVPASSAAVEGDDSREKTCSRCLLRPDEIHESAVDANDPMGGEQEEEELVACAKCDRRFHSNCCDPPHAPISLLNPENGEVLIADLNAPFVCSECTSCAGCHRLRKPDDAEQQKEGEVFEQRWAQWRLPLQAAALCSHCLPFYETKRFCAVCNLVLDDEALATSVDLLTCSTCQHWVHSACEPDPHPAFHAFSGNADFSLDVVANVPDISLSPSRAVDSEADAESVASFKTPMSSPGPEHRDEDPPLHLSNGNSKSSSMKEESSGSKTARQVDEEFAHSLRFAATYDPKALHKYECLTCRKMRMLHVLYRLAREDKLDLFKEPVTKAIAPTYFDVIKEPMDLSTMQRKILTDQYTLVNFREFRDDFELMCLNAVTFNSKERDFLIWREAWRFYGQGQKIFRQTAPKSRMKQRGGRHYDALLIAAKRQLPNNSVIGKTHLNSDTQDSRHNSSDGEDNDDDEDDDDDEGEVGEKLHGAGDEEHGHDSRTTHTIEANGVPGSDANGGDASTNTAESKSIETSDGSIAGGISTVSSALTVSGDRRAVAKDSFVMQTELRTTGKLHSRVPLFKIMQTRTSAHTYCWLDMCVVCGSAGLPNDLIFCVDCGEGFHTFCVPGMSTERLEDNDQLRLYWRCPNCKMCEICGQPGEASSSTSFSASELTAGNVDGKGSTGQGEASGGEPLLLCAHCDRGYHGSCLLPAIKPPSHCEGDESADDADETALSSVIYCASCITCTSCSSNTVEYQHSEEAEQAHLASLERTYSYDQHSCLRCHDRQAREARALMERSKPLTQLWAAAARKSKKDAEKCPLCSRKWDANSEELMQCDACERWAHPQCDELLQAEPERYQTLVSDPHAVYVCGACRPKERLHISQQVPDGEGWRCQGLIANIQRKRWQCDARWKEARAQMALAKQWKLWADHTPVYLYVLRLGEECLRNFAFRSLNFQGDWSRFTKAQELEASGVKLPDWLVRKASRYLRFKRYARGPRAAARRRERKSQSFYSKQAVGVNTRKDASAICPIVSEAASCAALLACVHLLYGWRPLPEVVIHLLTVSQDEDIETRNAGRTQLGESLLQRLRMSEGDGTTDGEATKSKLTLEQEIKTIKQQYDRRVAKRHLIREEALDLSLFGKSDTGTEVVATTPATEPSADVKEAAASLASAVPKSPSLATASLSTPSLLMPKSPRSPKAASLKTPAPAVHLTTALPLHGWPVSENTATGSETNAPDTAGFDDSRFCALCFMIGDKTPCGRLLYAESEQWVHVNCALWSMEVFESASGVLHKCQKAKHRSRLIRCDACGLMGATVGCCVSRCTTHYHFPCAVDAGVAFLPTGETCCPRASHLDKVARRLQATGDTLAVVPTPAASEGDGQDAESTKEVQEVNGDADAGGVTVKEAQEEHMNDSEDHEDENTTTADAESEKTIAQETVKGGDASSGEHDKLKTRESIVEGDKEDVATDTTQKIDVSASQDQENKLEEPVVAAPVESECVLPVINPRTEPRRRLFSDPPLVLTDMKKKKSPGPKRGSKPRPMCYRVGALTVHSLGHVFVGNASFHSRDAIYPLGFRSTRIFWSTKQLGARCLYECVVSSTVIEARKRTQTPTKSGDAEGSAPPQRETSRPRAVFKIVASDDQTHPIEAFSPEEALVELRSRVVALYEDQRGFSASPRGSGGVVEAERNPFLKRSSWFSFALSGGYFFGFGLPEIARLVEQLPHAATTAVSRRAIVRKLQRQQIQQGQSPLGLSAAATWAPVTHKRSHDALEQDTEVPIASTESETSALTKQELMGGTDEVEQQDEEVYEFTQQLPSAEAFQAAQRVVEQLVRAEQRAHQSSGCARTDGFEGNRLFDGPNKRVKVSLPPRRHALNKEASTVDGAAGSSGSSAVAMDLEHLPIAMQYRELRRRAFDERLLVRKSSIHGYGLFLKEPVGEGQMIVEYQGQMIGQRVADERERRYEEQGIGSCYMFRLDEHTIIDATRTGNLARFINHSCDPKAFARVVAVEGGEKKIVIFAKRQISTGDEVTYDYKFPIEDEAIRCDCSAPNCIGRMN